MDDVAGNVRSSLRQGDGGPGDDTGIAPAVADERSDHVQARTGAAPQQRGARRGGAVQVASIKNPLESTPGFSA